MDFMSVTIFDLTSNKWTCMLEETCWMTQAKDINISSNILDKMLDRFK